MRDLSKQALDALAEDVEHELAQLRRLEGEIGYALAEMRNDPKHAALYSESLALKLHNFYTGCERIFQAIAEEWNSGLPMGHDWHRRLLQRMGSAREGRPAVISSETERSLDEYLRFRHVIRNLYGFELDSARLERLLAGYPTAWRMFESDVNRFVSWLRDLAARSEVE